MTEANGLNAATTGIVGNTGTAFTGTAVTQYNLIVGGSTSSTLANIAPSATSGIPVISQGSSSNPTYGTAAIAGGGTNAVSYTQSNGIVVYNGTSLVNYAGPQINSSGIHTNTSQPAFFAYQASAASSVTGDGTTYRLGSSVALTKIYDQGTNFNTNGTFTAPVTGIYQFCVCIDTSGIASQTQSTMTFVVSGTSAATYYGPLFNPVSYNAGNTVIQSHTTYIKMTATDTIVFNINLSGSTKTVTVGGQALGSGVLTYVSGALIC